jgi:hypothetical protein
MTAPITKAYTTAPLLQPLQQMNSTLIKAFKKDSLQRLFTKALKYVVAKIKFCDRSTLSMIYLKIKQASGFLCRYRVACEVSPEVSPSSGDLSKKQ